MFHFFLIGAILIPIIQKFRTGNKFNYVELLINVIIICVAFFGVRELGKYGKTLDVEIWNGILISKHREHDSYTRSYSCNCTTDSKGNETCDTCHEDHYTVEWYIRTSIGNIQIDYIDRTTRWVYKTPDPKRYIECEVGEPVSKEFTYVNYVQAAPNSIYHNLTTNLTYKKPLPYPRVYDYYRINRVLEYDKWLSNSGEAKQLNDYLNQTLRYLGTSKQANIIVVFAPEDPTFRYWIEEQWEGGNKNDVIILIGKNWEWVDVITWVNNTGNEQLQVQLRDELLNTPHDPLSIHNAIVDNITRYYTRPKMKDYEYLKDYIEPPLWVEILGTVLTFGISILLSYLFTHNDW